MAKQVRLRPDGKYYLPLRFLLNFHEEGIEYTEDVLVLGSMYSDLLDQFIQKRFQDGASIHWVESVPGSLDNFTFLVLDSLNVLGDTMTTFMAAKMIAEEVGSFLETSEVKTLIRSYLVGVGAPIQSATVPQLTSENKEFSWQNMLSRKGNIIAPEAVELLEDEKTPEAPPRSKQSFGTSILIGLGFLGLLGFNLYQSHRNSEEAKDLLSTLNDIEKRLSVLDSEPVGDEEFQKSDTPAQTTVQIYIGTSQDTPDGQSEIEPTKQQFGSAEVIIIPER